MWRGHDIRVQVWITDSSSEILNVSYLFFNTCVSFGEVAYRNIEIEYVHSYCY